MSFFDFTLRVGDGFQKKGRHIFFESFIIFVKKSSFPVPPSKLNFEKFF